ncbi:MAG: amidase [Actinomycetota bacterium]
MSGVSDLGVGALGAGLTDGRLDAREVIADSLGRAEAANPRLNAFVELRPEAIEEAASASGPLAGVPVAIKDMFVDRGRAPTAGSHAPARGMTGTAAAVERLRAAGAAIVGYANLHEWALGMTSAVTATGPVRNPWDLERTPGGSSGGSAAAVAAGIVPAAIGSDAGGSIRCPAACCGIVGFKPTWGRVPMEGFAAGECEIDHVGPLARSSADARLLFDVLSGAPSGHVAPEELRVGIARAHFFADIDPTFEPVLEDALGVVRRIVASVTEVEVARADTAGWAVGMLLLPHCARLLADDLAQRPETFQRETLDLLRIGAEMAVATDPCDHDHVALVTHLRRLLPTRVATSVGALPGPLRAVVRRHLFNRSQGREARRRVVAAWDDVFADVDVVVTPTVPAPPPRIDEGRVVLPSGRTSPDKAYLPITGPMNLGGVPALSLPCGLSAEGWPVSLTFTADRGRDDLVLSLGEAFERATAGAYANRIAPRG